MKLLILALFLTFNAVLYASSSGVIVLAFYKNGESAVSLTVPAKFLAAEIRIESSEEDWGLRLSAIEEARAQLMAAAKKEGMTLKIDSALIFEQSRSKFSFSSSAGNQHDSFSDVLLLAPLNERSNLVDLVKKFHAITTGLKTGKKAKVTVGSISLALDDPEQHRAELLKKIRTHVESSAEALFAKPSYTISGIDGPLNLRQSGEREIELSLSFRVNYSGERQR